ncbi:MAG: hypothetical protein R3D71_09475 [Rickettsiales bacterium]
MSKNDYIIEYIKIGNSVKVTAFDPKTLKEVSIIGAVGTDKKQLAELAIRKLIYMIDKNSE